MSTTGTKISTLCRRAVVAWRRQRATLTSRSRSAPPHPTRAPAPHRAQAAGQLPPFDVLVTNPPYTQPHPQRLLEFCVASKKPWLALMPNWVCTKDYYYPSLGQPPPSQHGPPPTADGSDAFYLAPRKRYHYWTPKGRRADVSAGGAKAKTHGHTSAALGARTSPFVSFWYCGGIKPKLRKRLAARPLPDGCALCWGVNALPPGVREG